MASRDITPMIRQYLEIKGQHPDAILFFRLGDFYEMFFEDAHVASRILDIALTSRDKENEDAVPMCGVPYHSAFGYISKLLDNGFKVAICEQVEDPKLAKGIVRREVIRVVTPGVALDPEGLEPRENNYLLALSWDGTHFGLSYTDASTGEFRITELASKEALLDEMKRISPKELLVPKDKEEEAIVEELKKAFPGIMMTFPDGAIFEYRRANRLLSDHFRTTSLDGFGCQGMTRGIGAAGAVLHYLKETQKGELPHINRLQTYQPHKYMILDDATKRNLELFRSLAFGEKKGSLLWVLDLTQTPMGGRMLRRWMEFPLLNLQEIAKRLDAVEELTGEGPRRKSIRDSLIILCDIERLNGKISLGIALPRDLATLKESLRIIPTLLSHCEGLRCALLKELRNSVDPLEDVLKLLDTAIVDSPPHTIQEGGIVKDGFDPEVDELRKILREGKSWIAGIEAQERKRTRITSLKVGFNKVFGYFIEVTKPNLNNVPQDYIRKQTIATGERFITPELKEYEEKVLGAEEKVVELEKEIFARLRSQVSQASQRLQKTAEALASLDVLACLAEVAVRNTYSRPRVDEGAAIAISEGRHPVIEAMNREERFIPNDIRVDTDENSLLIITGPNMAGKSTAIRQAALITLMAQMGSFVPAEEARVGLVDRIFTRVGASDDLVRGRSTFMVEMNETANILHNATKKSLVVLDEIGRGTSTFDGISIAWAVAEYIHDRIGARALFATHFHELTELALTKQRVKNWTVAVKEWGDRVIFLRKLVEGTSPRSFGIQVAKLAGLPQSVLDRAKEILSNLESGELDEVGKPRLAESKRSSAETGVPAQGPAQLSLFSNAAREAAEEIRKLDLTTMTPVEALVALEKLKKKLQ